MLLTLFPNVAHNVCLKFKPFTIIRSRSVIHTLSYQRLLHALFEIQS